MNRKAVAAARRILESVEFKMPLDIHGIAAAHGIEVEKQSLERAIVALMVTNASGALITINIKLSPNQERFALAHALGHYLLHRDSQDVFIDRSSPSKDSDKNQTQQENEANEFAAELLMPEKIVRERFSKRRPYPYNEKTLRPLASQLGISELALAVRLTKLGLSDA